MLTLRLIVTGGAKLTISIQADDVCNAILCSASVVEVARDKRELETFQCTGDAKRLKKPG